MNLTEIELQRLANSRSQDEWDKLCEWIRKLRDGQWPPDWEERIVKSKLLDIRVMVWAKLTAAGAEATIALYNSLTTQRNKLWLYSVALEGTELGEQAAEQSRLLNERLKALNIDEARNIRYDSVKTGPDIEEYPLLQSKRKWVDTATEDNFD